MSQQDTNQHQISLTPRAVLSQNFQLNFPENLSISFSPSNGIDFSPINSSNDLQMREYDSVPDSNNQLSNSQLFSQPIPIKKRKNKTPRIIFSNEEEEEEEEEEEQKSTFSNISQTTRPATPDISPISVSSSQSSQKSRTTSLPIQSSQRSTASFFTQKQLYENRVRINKEFEWNEDVVTVEEKINLTNLACLILQLEKGEFSSINQFKYNKNHLSRNSFIEILKEYLHSFTIESDFDVSDEIYGFRTVEYRQTSPLHEGRYYAKGGLSLQSITKCIRHSIQDCLYDIDMKSAHPTILCQIARKDYNLVFFNLEKYIQNKDAIVNEIIQLNWHDAPQSKIPEIKSYIKDIILSVINGGSYLNVFHKPSQWWKDYFKEAQEILKTIVHRLENDRPEYLKKYQDSLKENPNKNKYGSIVSNLLCNTENILNFYMRRFCKQEGLEVRAICHDGIMVDREEFVDEDFLRDMEEYVFENTHYKINLAIKEPDMGLKVSRNLKKEITPEHHIFVKPTVISRDSIGSYLQKGEFGFNRLIEDKFQNLILLFDLDSKYFYLWNPNTCLWDYVISDCILDKFSEYLQSLAQPYYDEACKAHDDCSDTKQKKILEGQMKTWAGILSKLRATATIKNAWTFCKTKFHLRATTIVMNHHLKHCYPIAHNLKINFKTLEVSRRTPEDYFTTSFDLEYLEHDENDRNFQICEQLLKNIVVDDEDYYKYFTTLMGYCLTAETSDRSFYVFWGIGKNGKSKIVDVLNKLMGGDRVSKDVNARFIATLQDGSLLERKGTFKKSGQDHTTNLMPLMNTRCCLEQEGTKDVVLAMDIIKKITTSNEKVALRQIHEKGTEGTSYSKVILVSNYKPKFDGGDVATQDRIKFLPLLGRFIPPQDPNDEEGMRKYEENHELVKKYIENGDGNNYFFSIFARAVHQWYLNPDRLKILPEIVKNQTQDIIVANDPVQIFINNHIFFETQYKRAGKSQAIFDFCLKENKKYCDEKRWIDTSKYKSTTMYFKCLYEKFKSASMLAAEDISKDDFKQNLMVKGFIFESKQLEVVLCPKKQRFVFKDAIVDEKYHPNYTSNQEEEEEEKY
jgi:phage/plasmid-associated DNA primase